MAIIPGTAKVLNQYENVNTTYGGSKAMKAQSKWYTMDDVLETVEANIPGGGVTEIIAGDGISVDQGTGAVTVTNTVEPYVAPYKVFTAVVSQAGDNTSPNNLLSGPVQAGVTYKLSGVSVASDFSNVGGPGAGEAIDDTYFIAINNETPLNYGGGTLVYDVATPVVTILENTIGNIYCAYYSGGSYALLGSSNLFTDGKTFINNAQLTGYPVFNKFIETDGSFIDRGYFLSKVTQNEISLKAVKNNGALGDDLLTDMCIEIRVYN